MTTFAVATVKQGQYLRNAHDLGDVGIQTADFAYIERGWIERKPMRGVQLTDAGQLALELREALGPDRNLTVAGAKAILRDNGTRATRTRLMEDGLRKRSFVIGQESTLTEDGERVKAILTKYRAEF